jgi:flagellin
MGLRVNTNIASITAQKNLFAVTNRLQGNFSRLSSGLRIASASDDAAGLGISERMRSQVRSMTVASRNAQDGISMAQTAEGALNEVSNILGRMRELSMQGANGTMSTEDRATLDVEFQALDDEIQRISDQTQFNGTNILDGVITSVAIQVGINANETIDISLVGTDSTDLGTVALDVTTITTSNAALTALDTAIDTINTTRGGLGASQNRMQSALASVLNARENLSAAESRIRDVDVAAETADLTRNSILQQAAVSVLSQANVQPQLALSLLG